MDSFTIYLPVAGMHFNLLLLLFIGFTVGVCGGFFGIGGAWIVTPALNIFGFPMPYAIGTDMAHMGGKSIVSTIRHGKFGNVDMRLGVSMIIGTTTGTELGARLVMALERLGLAESVIRKAYIFFLGFIGCYVLYDYISHVRRGKVKTASAKSQGETIASRLQRIKIPPMMHYPASGITCSMWLPVLVGFVTGIVASMLGVGGGFIRMPALIYLIGCPTAVAIGTDLFEVMITGAYGGFTYMDACGCGLWRPARDGCSQVRTRLFDSSAICRYDIHRLRIGYFETTPTSDGVLRCDSCSCSGH